MCSCCVRSVTISYMARNQESCLQRIRTSLCSRRNMSQTLVDSPNLYFSLPLLLLPLLILILIVKYFKNSSKSLQIPPGPYPWPLVGNLFHMGKMPHFTLANFAKTYGPLISLRLGTQLMVVASSPAAAMEILKTHDRVSSGRYFPQSVPIKESEINKVSMGFALECGERWKFFRTICRTELFSAKALQAQECLRERKVMEMVTYISSKEGMAVDIGEIVFTSIYNMLTNILLSKDIFNLEDDSRNEGIKGVIRTAMEILATPNISDFYPILSRLDLQGLKKKSKEWCEKMNATWALTIKERREKNGTGLSRDFLDVLIENNLTDDCINQLLQELLSAGSDTSSSTIEWTVAELIRSPESMKEIVQELDREIKQDVVEESQLPQLIYLDACIKETLRLHPPTPFLIPHRAQESCEVMNYAIPKNSKVMVNVWAIGRDSRYWEDPLEFKPVRFLDSSLDYKGTNFEYIPFGAGRRICPGLPMAAKQVSFVLASLLHFFDWSLPHGVDPKTLDMKEKFGLTLDKEQPLLLIPTPRVKK